MTLYRKVRIKYADKKIEKGIFYLSPSGAIFKYNGRKEIPEFIEHYGKIIKYVDRYFYSPEFGAYGGKMVRKASR